MKHSKNDGVFGAKFQTNFGAGQNEKLKTKLKRTIAEHPERSYGTLSRQLLYEDFQIPEPSDVKQQLEKVRKDKNTLRFSFPVPTLRPSVELPAKELDKGIFHLIQRGLIPSSLDLTVAFKKAPSPLVATKVKFEHPSRKHEKKDVMTMLDLGINFSNLKYDFVSPISIPTTEYVDTTRTTPETNFIRSVTPTSTFLTETDLNGADGRKYDQLLDEFSLHHIIIRKGIVVSDTPEFTSFRRTYLSKWNEINYILSLTEKLFQQYHVNLAQIDGKKLSNLVPKYKIDNPPPLDELLACVVNYDLVVVNFPFPQFRFKGKNGEHNAAVCIQKNFKMYKAKKLLRRLKELHSRAKVIQLVWKLYKLYKRTKEKIKERLDREEDEWNTIMTGFCNSWTSLKEEKRVIVHIPSMTLDEIQREAIPNFFIMQNSQLGRICDILQDENVEVIYVTPFEISEEALDYYFKLCQIGGILEPQKRIKIVKFDLPPNAKPKTSLANMIYSSQRMMNLLKVLICGRKAYIVPGTMGRIDGLLAMHLKLPIFGPNPQRSLIYGTKSGAKRIFQAAEMNTPPSIANIYEEVDIYIQLSKKIVQHPEYNRWLLKVDIEGRGIAFLDTQQLGCLTEDARNLLLKQLENTNGSQHFLDALRDKVFFELKENFNSLIKIVSSYVYPNWKSMVAACRRYGVVIEPCPSKIIANPSVHLLIEPDGNISVLGIQEQIQYPHYATIGYVYPQHAVKESVLQDAAKAIAKVCFSKQIFGYISIDFVAFLTESNVLRLWAVDLKIRLTDASLHHQLFRTVITSTPPIPSINHRSTVQNTERGYIYLIPIRHPSFLLWRHAHFFSLCRLKNISFDLQQKRGVIFQLLSSISIGAFGFLCIDADPSNAVFEFANVIDLINSQLPEEEIESRITDRSNLFAFTKLSRMLTTKIAKTDLQQTNK